MQIRDEIMEEKLFYFEVKFLEERICTVLQVADVEER